MKAEWALAKARPSEELCEAVQDSISNEDAFMCSYIDDEYSIIAYGMILHKMKKNNFNLNDSPEEIAEKLNLSEDQIRTTIEAEKVVQFLKNKQYTKDEIKRIGEVSRLLSKNEGDVEKTAKECEDGELDSVEAVKALLDEYKASNIVYSPSVSKPSQEKKTTSSRKSSTKKTAQNNSTEMEKPFTTEPVTAQ